VPQTPTPINVRLRGDQTKGRLAVMENPVAAGFAGPPPHVRPDFDETFYVLEGELTFQVGDERLTALRGRSRSRRGEAARLRQPWRDRSARAAAVHPRRLRALLRTAGGRARGQQPRRLGRVAGSRDAPRATAPSRAARSARWREGRSRWSARRRPTEGSEL
jgi:hypothetical protein